MHSLNHDRFSTREYFKLKGYRRREIMIIRIVNRSLKIMNFDDDQISIGCYVHSVAVH